MGCAFFSALCGLLAVLATFDIARREWGLKAAWWSALVMLSSLHLVVQFRLATPDPYLILFHVLSIYFYYFGWRTTRWYWYGAMYLALGLALLAKGPIGLLLPGLTILLFLLWTRSFRVDTILQAKPWWGAPIVLLVAVPWYWMVHVQTNGLWTNGFFLQHNLGRFNDGIGAHSGPFILSYAFVLAGMLPFSFFAVRSFRLALKERREEPLLVMAITAVASVVVFYSLSKTKLINYTAPTYPFFALVVGYYFSKLTDGKLTDKRLGIEWTLIALLALALPVGGYFYLKNTDPLQATVEHAWVLAFLPLGALWAWLIWPKSKSNSLVLLSASFMVTSLLFFAILFPEVDRQSPIRKYQGLVENNKHVVAYRNFDDAFVFYSVEPIKEFEALDELQSYLLENDSVLVLSRERNLSYMDSIPNLQCQGIGHDLFSRRSSGVWIEK